MATFNAAPHSRYDELIDRYAAQFHLPPPLIKGLIQAESGFNAAARRHEPALGDTSRGLMQLLYATARGLGYAGPPDGLYDPETNVVLGALYLRQLLNAYDQDARLALAAYNCGPEVVDRARKGYGPAYADIEAHLPKITRTYVTHVLANAADFAAHYRTGGSLLP